MGSSYKVEAPIGYQSLPEQYETSPEMMPFEAAGPEGFSGGKNTARFSIRESNVLPSDKSGGKRDDEIESLIKDLERPV